MMYERKVGNIKIMGVGHTYESRRTLRSAATGKKPLKIQIFAGKVPLKPEESWSMLGNVKIMEVGHTYEPRRVLRMAARSKKSLKIQNLNLSIFRSFECTALNTEGTEK